MDTALTSLVGMLPTTWQPYAIAFLIVAYVITKLRSNQKSTVINTSIAPKEMQKRSTFSYMMEFLF